MEDPDNELKNYASGYELRSDGKVYNRELNTPVIETVEDLIEVIEFVHKDLGHYGKRTTLDGVRERYEVASNLWEEGGEGVGFLHPLSTLHGCSGRQNSAHSPLWCAETFRTMGNRLRR